MFEELDQITAFRSKLATMSSSSIITAVATWLPVFESEDELWAAHAASPRGALHEKLDALHVQMGEHLDKEDYDRSEALAVEGHELHVHIAAIGARRSFLKKRNRALKEAKFNASLQGDLPPLPPGGTGPVTPAKEDGKADRRARVVQLATTESNTWHPYFS